MHHIKSFNKEFKKNVNSISPEAEKLLLNYPWYGNARELRNVVERICILEDTDIIYPEHLPSEIIEYIDTESEDSASIDLPSNGLSLKDVEKDLIVQALKKADSNQTKAAKLLGISRDALRYKMQKFKIL
jgi:two-component system NtrC family response regulator